MPIEISRLVANIRPERTVLLFGAGSSIPSGAPSVDTIQRHLEQRFAVKREGYSLAEQSGIIENQRRDRQSLIREIRSLFTKLRPTGGLLNLPLYNWKSIYTTNYDELVELSYERRDRKVKSFSSNFDFNLSPGDDEAVHLFKLHGTIKKDVSDGDHSRMILTENDYALTEEFREFLFDRFKSDIAGAQLIIIGHSLADPDIKSVIDRAAAINMRSGLGGRISLFMYTKDEGRASLYENRGIDVCFGGLDDFFAAVTAEAVSPAISAPSDDLLDKVPALRPTTVVVADVIDPSNSRVSAIYNGWPATYSDVSDGLTFRRNIADQLCLELESQDHLVAVLLGASGVGKTTAVRQTLFTLHGKGWLCWEHKPDQMLNAGRWREVASAAESTGQRSLLFIDEAHTELTEINDLVDQLVVDAITKFKVVLVSSRIHWTHRVKTPSLFKVGKEYSLSRVQSNEIDRLLDLVQSNDDIRPLVEDAFGGFSRPEKRRRLVERCEADMFVCLKNIFSSERLDDIILREYATLEAPLQEVYRVVAAMETAGVRVHRQLVIRLLSIPAMQVGTLLSRLSDVIYEQDVDDNDGIYAWHGRHRVIMGIIAEHKYYDHVKRFDLLSRVIGAISPTYPIEIRTLRELCNLETGIGSVPDKREQNTLLRKMVSVAPSERVPRHRLMRNLIELGDFEQAETEIRLFQKDFGLDGPSVRYRINLATARAVRTPGILHEDRLVLIDKAREMAVGASNRYKNNKAILGAFCEVGMHYARLTGDPAVFDMALGQLKEAETRVGDPDISRMVVRLERRMSSIAIQSDALELMEDGAPEGEAAGER